MPQNLYDDTLEQVSETRSPFEDALEAVGREEAQARTVRTSTALKVAADTTPDRAAEVARLSSRLKLPATFVERNFDTVSQRAKEDDHAQLQRTTPKLAEWLSDPANAAVAQDDLDTLRTLEQGISFGGAILRGVDNAQAMTGGFLEASGELVGAKGLAGYGRGVREHNEAQAGALVPATDVFALTGPWDLVQFVKEAVGEQIPIMGTIAASATAGAAIGSVVPVVGTAIGGIIGAVIPAFAMGVGEVQGAIKGIDPNAVVPAAAFIGGSAVAAFDTIIPGRIGSKLVRTFGREIAERAAQRALLTPVAPKFIRGTVGATASGMAVEGLTEALQEAIGMEAAALGTGTDLPTDFWTQVVAAGAKGLVVGGIATGTTEAATFRRRQAQAVAAQQQQVVFDALATGITDSKLVKRMPEAAQAFLAQATKDGPLETVYAPLDTWTTYWQEKGLDPALMAAEVTGDPEAYATAQRTGEDLAIPTAAYAVKLAGSEHHGYFTQELRLGDPEAMNLREATVFQQEQQAATEAAATAETPVDPAEAIKAELVTRLVEGGLLPQATAETVATLFSEALPNLAERAGLDLPALVKEWLPEIQTGEATPQAATQTNEALAARLESADPAEVQAATAEVVALYGTPVQVEGGRWTWLDLTHGSASGVMRAEGDTGVAGEPVGPESFNQQGRVRVPMTAEEQASLALTPEEQATADQQVTPSAATLAAMLRERADEQRGPEGRMPARLAGLNQILKLLGRQPMAEEFDQPGPAKAGPPNAAGVFATFVGWQQGFEDIPAMALYNVSGGKFDRSTVTVEELAAEGIPIPETPPQPETFDQPLFHGSPHNFDRFTTDAMGTGEGVQAFGWGLYFAENKDVAEGYQRHLSGGNIQARNYTRDGQMLESVGEVWEDARDAAQAAGGATHPDQAGSIATQVQDWVSSGRQAETYMRRHQVPKALQAAFKAAIEEWKGVRYKVNPGRLYQVDIADEQIAKMLDWDKLLSEQSAHVLDALEPLMPEEQDLGWQHGNRYFTSGVEQGFTKKVGDVFHAMVHGPGDVGTFATVEEARAAVEEQVGPAVQRNTRTGEEFYRALSDELGGDQEASQALLEAGIPGLRFLDQGSRANAAAWGGTPGEREGTRNVVVFDDAIITLTHKDGTPVSQQERKEFFQPGRSDARGRIAFRPGQSPLISLFEQRDLSTMLHESGHLFRQLLRQIATQLATLDPATLTPEQQQLLADQATLDGWLTGDDRAQHEQFARGFEAYLLDGKAPSAELRAAFARFRAWLLGIYKSVAGLNVQLNPDVRAVMDRLVASDAAIAEAEQSAAIAPLFTTPESAGMTPAEFAPYVATLTKAGQTARQQLDQQFMAEVQREQTAQWKAEREALRVTVEAEVSQQPVYRALAAMRSKEVPGKLSKTLIVQRYGADRLKRLPKPYLYTVEGGLDPEAMAELFGFSSGDELLLAVEQAPPLRQVVERQTSQRMLTEHGSLLLDGTLGEQAQAAVANADREAVIRAELKALGKLRRTVGPHLAVPKRAARGGAARIRAAMPSAESIRQAAQQRIASLTVRAIRPNVFWVAARRAGREAIDAAAAQDFDTAIAAKQQELLNVALYREATRVKADIDARVQRAKDLGTTKAQQRLGLAGSTYLEQVLGILDRYEFSRVSQKALDRRASMRKWVAALEGEGLPVDLPEELLEETRRINYQELTVEELIGVTDGLAQILHLSRLKNKLLKAQDKRSLDELAADLSASIREHGTTRRDVARDRRPSEERRRTVEDWFAGHRKLASTLREMDGFADGGPAWDAIMRPLNEAGSREAEMNAHATEQFAGLIEAAFPGREKRQLYTKSFIPAIKDSLSTMERLMVALNWGNEGNRQRVRDAEGWTDAQVQAILDTLSASDVRFVQGVWDFINSYWTEIAAKQARVTGVAPEKVEAMTVQTRHGDLRGGYFPLKYDDRLSASAIAHLDLDAAGLAKQAAYTQATTRRGHTKARVEHVELPIRRDFGVMFEHVQQVIHDLSHHETLIDVGRILGHADVQQAILATQGDGIYKQLRGAVKDIAFGDAPAVTGFERAINHVRIGATIAGLGWNVTTAFLQPLGLSNSMARIGPQWVAKGLVRWLRHPTTMVETVEWITDKSAFMRSRGRTQQREINEIRNSIGVNTGRLGGWVDEALDTATFDTVTRQGIADSYFWMIQQMQRVADVPTWLGQYEKSMAAGETEARAVALADQAVLDSQGGGQMKDLSQVQRGGPMMKLWTNFYSYFNVVLNQLTESTRRTTWRSPGSVGRLASDYLLLISVPATLGYLLREALRPGDDTEDALGWRLLMENFSYLSGTMLGLREISSTLQGYAGYEGPAGARFFASLGRFGQQAQQGDLDAAFWRALNDVGGVLFHYPSGQARKTIDGVTAIAEGRTKNPAALLMGAPRGR